MLPFHFGDFQAKVANWIKNSQLGNTDSFDLNSTQKEKYHGKLNQDRVQKT